MKKWIYGLMMLSPLGVWAQAEGAAAPAGYAVVQAAPKAALVPSAAGRFELTLEQLRERLVLTPAQRPAWSAYADKVTAYTEVFYREKPVLASQEDTAVHQVARLVDKLQNRLAALEQVESAAKALFLTLTPGQQQVANQLLIATLPTFTSVAPGADSQDRRRKPEKAEGAGRGHRGGGMGGGN